MIGTFPFNSEGQHHAAQQNTVIALQRNVAGRQALLPQEVSRRRTIQKCNRLPSAQSLGTRCSLTPHGETITQIARQTADRRGYSTLVKATIHLTRAVRSLLFSASGMMDLVGGTSFHVKRVFGGALVRHCNEAGENQFTDIMSSLEAFHQ